jgi:hypothetical protein
MRRIQNSLIVSFAIASALGASACTSSNAASGGATTSATPDAGRRGGNFITQAEIEQSGTTNALEAIKRLRPNFLVLRGTMSRNSSDIGIVVYSNTAKMGNTSTLETIPTSEIKQVEFVSATDATQRYGVGHTHGAIIVTRK